MIRYSSKVDWVYKASLILIASLDLLISLTTFHQEGVYAALVISSILTLTLAYLISLYYTTSYLLHNDYLRCSSGWIVKKIAYQTIKKIEKNKGLYIGWKLSLALDGLIIYYHNGNELFISPENLDQFIDDLEQRISTSNDHS
ncbi:MAG: PH domain-containing protein [Flavobacteriia bacterium]|nr:PH domain-containing protein [Flavobacteriia bacterium]